MNKRTVIVNFSGGKDSTAATLEALKRYPKDEIVLCWQDTGAEYLETPAHIQLIANTLELPLIILRYDKDFWELARSRGYFPHPFQRQCTAYLKRDLFKKWVRHNRDFLGDEVVIVFGLRGEESQSRSKLSEWGYHITHLKDGSFTARVWLPCLRMSEQEVKDRIKAEGLPLHPCYDFSSRCSCWCCIFQPNSVVRTYAEAHPDLYQKACLLEEDIKHKWKDGFGFNDLMKQGKLL